MSQEYKREDFTNSNEVKWCPGCGDYAILAAIQKLLPELGLAPEKHVFVSGIGCSGRLPYYMNTYGFHTIHGRAPAIATGLKAMREDLSVWVITGDGDGLSIGTNHLIHSLRRNVNIKILLFNNQIYGLTKGQFSPTSKLGQITKTSPQGVTMGSLNPVLLALSAGASFVARAVDKDPLHLGQVLKRAYHHQGVAFVEIYQDCNIFNNGAFDAFSLKENRGENTLLLEQGQPMLLGNEKQWAISLDNDQLVKVAYQAHDKVLIHEETDFLNAVRLARLNFPEMPVPLGVYYQEEKPLFTLPHHQTKTEQDLHELYRSKVWWQA